MIHSGFLLNQRGSAFFSLTDTYPFDSFDSSKSLPIGSETKVTIIAYRKLLQLFYNDTFVEKFTISSWRYPGNALVAVSSKNSQSAIAILRNFSITPYGDQLVPNIDFQSTPQANVIVPVNYMLSFKILPLGNQSGLSNIFHYSGKGKDTAMNALMPALWFLPGTTTLSFRVSTVSNASDGFDSAISLPIGSETKVTFIASRTQLQLFLNDTASQNVTISSWRFFGNASLFVSSFSYLPALAILSNLSMVPYGDQTTPILSQKTTPQASVFVPVNYRLSFNVTPLSERSELSNILHYSGNGKDYGINPRMPAVWFLPGTTRLSCYFSTVLNPYEMFDSAKSLPIGSETKVTIIAYRMQVQLFFNDTSVQNITLSSWRYSGNASLYVSNQWSPSALAILSNLSIIPYMDQFVPNLAPSTNYIGGAVFVPVDYKLSFSITPLGNYSELSNIFHYSGNGNDYGLNVRLPALWFLPGSTRLSFRFSTISGTTDGFDSVKSLPIGSETKVTISVFGSLFQLYLNGTSAQNITLSSQRRFGNAYLYISNQWQASAIAILNNFLLTPLYHNQMEPNFAPNATSQATLFVPVNYKLSCIIIPLANHSQLSNAFFFSQNQYDMGPSSMMPSLWFLPGTTRLGFRFFTNANSNSGFDSVKSLPIGAETKVTIITTTIANQPQIQLFLNDTPSEKFTLTYGSWRYSGNASLLVSHPWYPSAIAIMRNVSIAPY